LYSRYLLQSRGQILEVNISLQAQEIPTRKVLTKQQIEKLYGATNDDPYGLRDRAMLAVYYGCGLRKSEGARLKIQDIRLESNLVYVQRGKHYRSRFVPLAQGVRKDLVNYLTIGRPMLIRGALHEGLFVSRTGKWMSKSGLYEALQRLCRNAEIAPVGLHCLRHSIATHLLQNGVPLKQIARFLGHRSIESTQLYTQLLDVCI
jgi:site-specific recombinase XerD